MIILGKIIWSLTKNDKAVFYLSLQSWNMPAFGHRNAKFIYWSQKLCIIQMTLFSPRQSHFWLHDITLYTQYTM